MGTKLPGGLGIQPAFAVVLLVVFGIGGIAVEYLRRWGGEDEGHNGNGNGNGDGWLEDLEKAEVRR